MCYFIKPGSFPELPINWVLSTTPKLIATTREHEYTNVSANMKIFKVFKYLCFKDPEVLHS